MSEAETFVLAHTDSCIDKLPRLEFSKEVYSNFPTPTPEMLACAHKTSQGFGIKIPEMLQHKDSWMLAVLEHLESTWGNLSVLGMWPFGEKERNRPQSFSANSHKRGSEGTKAAGATGFKIPEPFPH